MVFLRIFSKGAGLIFLFMEAGPYPLSPNASRHTGLIWPGLIWPGLIWPGLIWPGLIWPGLIWPGLIWPGLIWIDVNAPVLC